MRRHAFSLVGVPLAAKRGVAVADVLAFVRGASILVRRGALFATASLEVPMTIGVCRAQRGIADHASDPQLWRKPRVAARPYRHLLPLKLRMTRDPCHISEDFIKPAHDPAANAQSEGEHREGEFLNQSKVGGGPGIP